MIHFLTDIDFILKPIHKKSNILHKKCTNATAENIEYSKRAEGGLIHVARFYRYRLPPWARNCIFICEKATLPILIFQLIRTLFFPTTLDVLLLGIFVGLFIAFHLEWI